MTMSIPVNCEECGTEIGAISAGYKLNGRTLCYTCFERTKSVVMNDTVQKTGKVSKEDFFSFRYMVSAKLVKVTYLIGLIAISVVGLGMVIGAFNMRGGAGGFSFFGGLAVLTLGNLGWRIFCEGLIIIFGLHETTVSILKELQSK